MGCLCCISAPKNNYPAVEATGFDTPCPDGFQDLAIVAGNHDHAFEPDGRAVVEVPFAGLPDADILFQFRNWSKREDRSHESSTGTTRSTHITKVGYLFKGTYIIIKVTQGQPTCSKADNRGSCKSQKDMATIKATLPVRIEFTKDGRSACQMLKWSEADKETKEKANRQDYKGYSGQTPGTVQVDCADSSGWTVTGQADGGSGGCSFELTSPKGVAAGYLMELSSSPQDGEDPIKKAIKNLGKEISFVRLKSDLEEEEKRVALTILAACSERQLGVASLISSHNGQNVKTGWWDFKKDAPEILTGSMAGGSD